MGKGVKRRTVVGLVGVPVDHRHTDDGGSAGRLVLGVVLGGFVASRVLGLAGFGAEAAPPRFLVFVDPGWSIRQMHWVVELGPDILPA